MQQRGVDSPQTGRTRNAKGLQDPFVLGIPQNDPDVVTGLLSVKGSPWGDDRKILCPDCFWCDLVGLLCCENLEPDETSFFLCGP